MLSEIDAQFMNWRMRRLFDGKEPEKRIEAEIRRFPAGMSFMNG